MMYGKSWRIWKGLQLKKKSQSIDLYMEKEQHERLKRELGFFEKLKKIFF